MGDMKVVKSMVGDTWEIRDDGIANEVLEEGDLCNFDADGELEKVDDGDTAHDLAIVLEDTVADQTGVKYVMVEPWLEIQGTQTGTIGDVGELLEIDIDTAACTVAPATGKLARFKITKVIDATNKIVRFHRVYGSLS
jgi:hypothetical protein